MIRRKPLFGVYGSRGTCAIVLLPKSNVSCKKLGYVYHIGKGYRNDKGQPASLQTIIGKYDTQTGMLIPNDNYFEIYGGKPQPRTTEYREHPELWELFSIEELERVVLQLYSQLLRLKRIKI